MAARKPPDPGRTSAFASACFRCSNPRCEKTSSKAAKPGSRHATRIFSGSKGRRGRGAGAARPFSSGGTKFTPNANGSNTCGEKCARDGTTNDRRSVLRAASGQPGVDCFSRVLVGLRAEIEKRETARAPRGTRSLPGGDGHFLRAYVQRPVEPRLARPSLRPGVSARGGARRGNRGLGNRLRDLGAPAPRGELERNDHAEGRPRTDSLRAVPPHSPSDLHRNDDRALRHRIGAR